MIDLKLHEIRVNELDLKFSQEIFHYSSDYQVIIDALKLRMYRFEDYVSSDEFNIGIKLVADYLNDNEYSLEAEMIKRSAPIMLKQSQIFVSSFYSDYKTKELWKNDCSRPAKNTLGDKECCLKLKYQANFREGFYLRKMIDDYDEWFLYFEEIMQYVDALTDERIKSERQELVKLGLLEDSTLRTYIIVEEIIKTLPWLALNANQKNEYRAIKVLQQKDAEKFDFSKQNYIDIDINNDSSLQFEKIICRQKNSAKASKNEVEENPVETQTVSQQDLFS